jgi:hypothetical protein
VGGIDEILRNAAKMGEGRSEGSGGDHGEPTSGEKGKDPKGEPKPEKRGPEEKKDPLAQNKPENGDRPEGGEKPKDPKDPKGKAPPPGSEKRPPDPKDAAGVFFARLPDKVREAVLNGDFDQVPEKYRDLLREWTRALAEQDRKDNGSAPAK